jgi:hypothetical protein
MPHHIFQFVASIPIISDIVSLPPKYNITPPPPLPDLHSDKTRKEKKKKNDAVLFSR